MTETPVVETTAILFKRKRSQPGHYFWDAFECVKDVPGERKGTFTLYENGATVATFPTLKEAAARVKLTVSSRYGKTPREAAQAAVDAVEAVSPDGQTASDPVIEWSSVFWSEAEFAPIAECASSGCDFAPDTLTSPRDLTAAIRRHVERTGHVVRVYKTTMRSYRPNN